jgi:hypothetical protein
MALQLPRSYDNTPAPIPFLGSAVCIVEGFADLTVPRGVTS